MILVEKWECEICIAIMETDWLRSSKYVLDISANITIHEAFVKLRSRWYLVPTRLHKMFLNMDTLYVGDVIRMGKYDPCLVDVPHVEMFWGCYSS